MNKRNKSQIVVRVGVLKGEEGEPFQFSLKLFSVFFNDSGFNSSLEESSTDNLCISTLTMGFECREHRPAERVCAPGNKHCALREWFPDVRQSLSAVNPLAYLPTLVSVTVATVTVLVPIHHYQHSTRNDIY
jgi:hypothetical protein